MNKFRYVSNVEKDFDLPTRATEGSCGYDFHSPVDVVIHPKESVMIKLNVKCEISGGEFLMIVQRSSLGMKGSNFVMMQNSVGIIDKDYYNNSSNEGNIGVKLYNNGSEDFIIKKNDRLVQGIFVCYDITEDDNVIAQRVGGFGSTGK